MPTLNPATCSTATGLPVWSINNQMNNPYTYSFNDTLNNGGGCGTTYFGSYNIAPPSVACAPNANMFSKNFPDWISTINNKMDLRGFYISCNSTSMYNTYFDNTLLTNPDVLMSTSPISGQNVAFTT